MGWRQALIVVSPVFDYRWLLTLVFFLGLVSPCEPGIAVA